MYNPADDIAVTISGLTVTGGDDEAGGAIALDSDTLTLADMIVTANTGDEGGGVFAANAVLVITDSTISENLADVQGGGGGSPASGSTGRRSRAMTVARAAVS